MDSLVDHLRRFFHIKERGTIFGFLLMDALVIRKVPNSGLCWIGYSRISARTTVTLLLNRQDTIVSE